MTGRGIKVNQTKSNHFFLFCDETRKYMERPMRADNSTQRFMRQKSTIEDEDENEDEREAEPRRVAGGRLLVMIVAGTVGLKLFSGEAG